MEDPDQWDDEKDIDIVVEDWIRFGKNVPLSYVPHDILYKISRHFSPEHEWQSLACHLGVTDLQTLKEISGDAYVEREWQSLVLLLYCAEHHHHPLTFSDLLTVLLKKLVRKDVLQRLHDSGCVEEFIREFPQKKSATLEFDESKTLIAKCMELIKKPAYPSRLTGPALERLCEVVMALPTVQTGTVAKLGLETQASEHLRSAKSKGNHLSEEKKENVDGGMDGDGDRRNVAPARSLSRARRFAVLLTYSPDVNDLVPAFQQRCWDSGIGVVSENTLQGLGFLESDLVGAWQSFFEQCHLVVPIISNQYLRDIKKPSAGVQSQGVRYVYTLFTLRYINAGCINDKVRPLVLDNLDSKKLKNINPTLNINWKLEGDVDEFMNVLNNSKNSFRPH